MNHKIAHISEHQRTASALVVLGTLAAVLVASAAAVGTEHVALAFNSTKTKDNDGISIPTDTKQKRDCQTAGATSPVSGSCTGISTNVVNQSGGVLR